MFEGYASRMLLQGQFCANWNVSGCPYAGPRTIVRVLNQDNGNPSNLQDSESHHSYQDNDT